MREVVPVLPTEGSSPAQVLTLRDKAVFHAAAPVNATHYVENRRKFEVHSACQAHFSILTVCQRRECYDFSDYSGLPGILVAFRTKLHEEQNFS